jgi:DnaK suppressor protein
MTNEELKFFEALLIDRKTQIENSIRNSTNEINLLREDEIKDEADNSNLIQEYMINDAITAQQEEEYIDIKHSLTKFREGKYGICEMCDDDIDIDRLRVKPHAKYCVLCRTIVEKEKKK